MNRFEYFWAHFSCSIFVYVKIFSHIFFQCMGRRDFFGYCENQNISKRDFSILLNLLWMVKSAVFCSQQIFAVSACHCSYRSKNWSKFTCIYISDTYFFLLKLIKVLLSSFIWVPCSQYFRLLKGNSIFFSAHFFKTNFNLMDYIWKSFNVSPNIWIKHSEITSLFIWNSFKMNFLQNVAASKKFLSVLICACDKIYSLVGILHPLEWMSENHLICWVLGLFYLWLNSGIFEPHASFWAPNSQKTRLLWLKLKGIKVTFW